MGKYNNIDWKREVIYSRSAWNSKRNSSKLPHEKSKKIQLIEAAARIIRSNVKSLWATMVDEYSSSNDLTEESALNYIPSSLELLLSKLLVGKLRCVKIGAVGQAVMQAIRPRSLLCLSTNQSAWSRYLIDILYHLGFCSYYSKVTRFERTVSLVSEYAFLNDFWKLYTTSGSRWCRSQYLAGRTSFMIWECIDKLHH